MESTIEDYSDIFSFNTSKLNDEEFNIPALDETPTLESILKEDDSSILSEDDLALYLTTQPRNTYKENEDNVSVSSSVMCRDFQNLLPVSGLSEYKYDPGQILRHSILKAVSAQLKSANVNILSPPERVNAGYPSAMHVSIVIAVGTSCGLVFVFDEQQILRWCHETDRERSSVSALCLNADCSRLLVGYACGAILMFDANDGKLLRTMNNVHTPSTAVLHVKFTDIPTLALCSDSGGSVFEMNFKRTLGVRGVETKCIFSGSKGEVCCVEPLLLYHLNSHPLKGSVLIAMATLTKLIVVCIRPVMKVLLTYTVRADPCSLPFLSWQFVIIQLTENFRIMDPVLAFARDRCINFYRVNVGDNNKLKCTTLQTLDLDYSILTCHWLNTRTVAMLDTKEQLHLFDVRSRQELEKLDLSEVGLVYNSSHFKGLSTGGNVSKAMALAGERACYNTVQSYGNQVVLLGLKSCHVVSIRSWIERLDSLVDKGKFECALRLGVEFLEERGKVMAGLQGRHHQRYSLVKNKVSDILITYIDLVLSGGNIVSSPIHNSIDTIINMAATLEQTNLLFERMWEGFEYNRDTVCRAIFLQNLAVSIIDEKVLDIPPAVMQQLVTCLADRQMWKELELCILNVSIERLDIQQVLKLSRHNSLHSALISIWNRALMDYTSPLQELLPKLQSALDTGQTEYARDLGNKLFVYISYCFAGRAYPRGDINDSPDNVRNQVFQCLCSQHSVKADEDEDIYPYLRLLLKFDTKEFLNVLAMAFNDHKFSTQLKQRFTDILIKIIFQSNTFKAHEIGWVFTFLCEHAVSEKSRPISIDDSLFEKIIIILSENEDPSMRDERQKAFAQLILIDNFVHYKEDQLLNLAEKAQFYLVCREIHQRRGEHGQVLKYYLLDSKKKHEVFSYLERSLFKEELKPHVMDHLNTLLEISSERTGFLFGKYYSDSIENAVSQITKRTLYYFLKGVTLCHDLDHTLKTLFLKLQCEMCDESDVINFVRNNRDLQLEPALKSAKEHNLHRVSALLLERLGNYQEAFDVLFSRLQDSIEKGAAVEDATEELISLMRRRSAEMDSKSSWLPLLKCLSNLNSRDLLKRVLGSADLYLAAELHLLLQNNRGMLGDFRDLITGLFEKCAYEHVMLRAVSRSVYSDLHTQLAKSLNEANRGISSLENCNLCKHTCRSKFLLFRCGHGYHTECVQTSDIRCALCSSVSADKNSIV